MKNLLPILICLLLIQSAFAQTKISFKTNKTVLKTSIYFEFGKAEILTTEKLKIENLLQQTKLAKGNIVQIVLRGHTDNFGSDYANKKLSNQRTKSVENHLKTLAISEAIIAAQGYGEFQLIIKKGNKITQHKNRRVSIELTYETQIEIKKPEIKPKKTITDFYNNTKKPYESFTITAGEATFVEGKEGTRIQFLNTSFDQLPTGTPIEIRMTEYYRFSDMLLANLTTEINGEMLSTGGMINAEAFAKGEPINMTGQAYIWFPHKERNMDNMQPFFGEEGEQGVTWGKYPGNVNESNYLRNFESDLRNYWEESYRGKITPYPSTKWNKFIWAVKHPFMYFRIKRNNRLYGNIQFDSIVNPIKISSVKLEQEFDKYLTDKGTNRETIQAALANEIMSVNRLGQINCDAFTQIIPKIKKHLNIMENPSKNLSIKVLCPRVNGILAAYPTNKNYMIQGLPRNENVVIVAIRTTNEKPELAIKKMNKIQDIIENELVFQAYDNIKDMRKAMRALD